MSDKKALKNKTNQIKLLQKTAMQTLKQTQVNI